MSKDKKKKRQQELERRLKQRPRQVGPVPDLMAAVQVLSQPDRFAAALRLFSERALLTPGLAGFRLPRGPLLDALLDEPAPPPGEADDAARRRAVRAAALPRLASGPLLEELQDAIQRAKKDVESEAELLALFAAQALATSCREEGGAASHVFWELPFDITLTDLLLSGELLVEVAMRALEPAEEEAAAAFARALVNPDLSRELDDLGVHERDPAALAARYAEIVRERDSYHLQLDGVLHLLWAQQQEVARSEEVLRVGLTSARRAEMAAAVHAAYRDDVSDQVRDDLLRWSRGRLLQLRDEPPSVARDAVEHERLRCGVVHLALRTLPREQDALLRAIHARSLLLARRRAPSIEVPFVHEVSARPDDLFAIDEYERFLTERGEVQRARRVRRYRDFVRRERAAQQEAQAQRPAQPGQEQQGEAGG